MSSSSPYGEFGRIVLLNAQYERLDRWTKVTRGALVIGKGSGDATKKAPEIRINSKNSGVLDYHARISVDETQQPPVARLAFLGSLDDLARGACPVMLNNCVQVMADPVVLRHTDHIVIGNSRFLYERPPLEAPPLPTVPVPVPAAPLSPDVVSAREDDVQEEEEEEEDEGDELTLEELKRMQRMARVGRNSLITSPVSRFYQNMLPASEKRAKQKFNE